MQFTNIDLYVHRHTGYRILGIYVNRHLYQYYVNLLWKTCFLEYAICSAVTSWYSQSLPPLPQQHGHIWAFYSVKITLWLLYSNTFQTEVQENLGATSWILQIFIAKFITHYSVCHVRMGGVYWWLLGSSVCPVESHITTLVCSHSYHDYNNCSPTRYDKCAVWQGNKPVNWSVAVDLRGQGEADFGWGVWYTIVSSYRVYHWLGDNLWFLNGIYHIHGSWGGASDHRSMKSYRDTLTLFMLLCVMTDKHSSLLQSDDFGKNSYHMNKIHPREKRWELWTAVSGLLAHISRAYRNFSLWHHEFIKG